MSGSASIHVYRVLQEALNNVTRHSGSQQAWVRLRFTTAGLELEVEDHGKGFNVDSPRPGIGLVAMRERAELFGRALKIVRPSGGGTMVACRYRKRERRLMSNKISVLLVDDHALVRRASAAA